MRLKRAVTVKVIVTEEFKSNLSEELNKTLTRVEFASQQLDMQLRRYVPEVAKVDLEQAGRLRREIEGERQRHENMRAEIKERLDEVTGLEIGSEFEQGNVESYVDVAVGDNLIEKLSGAEIVIKDGIIQEIRES
ncbi:MAG TPA: YlqD family protein [Armatimonadota bacterium]|nr:YlqD family protein [Armatimonadota bacterium]HOP80014.1 YlqD family protein [Armatimonadota bacterium]HPP75106.1 YlqD family protein [Armatimonadota bacterium]